MKRNKLLEEIRAGITPEQHEKYDKIIEEEWAKNNDLILIDGIWWSSVEEYEKTRAELNKFGRESTAKLMFGKKYIDGE